MDTRDAEVTATGLLREFGLDERGWTFAFDRAVKRFGLCDHNRRRITLSRALTERESVEEVEDIIRHEIAHAVAGGWHGHDREWRRACAAVGARPRRCHVSDTSFADKWEATCRRCGLRYTRTRMTDRVRFYAMCGRCPTGTDTHLVWRMIER